MATSAKARRSFPRWLLAIEFSVVVLIVSGGCYFKQNYQVLSPQMANESFSKCSVVIEGRVVYTYYKYPIKWEDYVFFCWPFGHEGPLEPNRYDLSIEIDKILKGGPDMPRRMQVDNCRPLTTEETALLSQFSDASGNMRVRIGFNSQHGNSFRNLIIVPLGAHPTTQPKQLEYRLIP